MRKTVAGLVVLLSVILAMPTERVLAKEDSVELYVRMDEAVEESYEAGENPLIEETGVDEAYESDRLEIEEDELDAVTDELTKGQELTIHVDGSEYIFSAGGFKVSNPEIPQYDSIEENGDEITGEHMLTASMDTLVDYIADNLRRRVAEIDVTDYNIVIDQNSRFKGTKGTTPGSYYHPAINNNPELFYVDSHYSYNYQFIGYEDGMPYYRLISYIPQYIDGYDYDAFDAAVDRAMSVVKPFMSDEQKAIALHEYLVINTAYDYQNYLNGTLKGDVYNAYGTLVNKIAVCQGYAEAYMYLLRLAGIKAYLVSSASMNHAWNMIVLDGEYYQVDVTWDDPAWDRMGLVSHKYMFLSDETFKNPKINATRHHDWQVEYGTEVLGDIIATSTKYEDAYWIGDNSELIFHSDDGQQYLYYSDYQSYKCRILRQIADYSYVKANNPKPQVVLANIPYWDVPGKNSYYAYSYVSLMDINDRLYYSTKDAIYSINYDGTDNKQESDKLSTSAARVYGAIYEDSRIKYVLQADPNVNAQQIYLDSGVSIENTIPNNEPTGRVIDYAIRDTGALGINFRINLPKEAYKVIIKKSKSDSGQSVLKSNMQSVDADVYSIDIESLYARMMGDSIILRVEDEASRLIPFVNEENVVDGEYITSCYDLLKNICTKADNNDLVELASSMKNYGLSAQDYLGVTEYYKSDASYDFGEALYMISQTEHEALERYAPKQTGSMPEGICYLGSSLQLKDNVMPCFYFRVNNGHSFEDYDFTVVNCVNPDESTYSLKDCEYVKIAGGRYRAEGIVDDDVLIIRVGDLAGADYDETFKIMVNRKGSSSGWSIDYSVYSYIERVLNTSSDDKLVKLATALYRFSEASKKYYRK